jgi:DNA polymerase-3 subunit gamma/tau
MQDAARNSLLKILEEPPETGAIILCSAKPEALLPTILSRLRRYAFADRGAAADAEVVRRVFKETEDAVPAHGKTESGINAYLDTFLPVPKNVLYAASAFFWASIASNLTAKLKGKGIAETPPALTAIKTRCAEIARVAGMGEPASGIKNLCAATLASSANFGSRGTFAVFLGLLCATLSEALSPVASPSLCAAYRRALQKCVEEARVAVDVYRQTPSLALERLSFLLLKNLSVL